MPRLESHDELGIPWDDLADGRVHRLRKGRDFVRGAELVEEAAANAAARLGRVVRTFREIRWGMVYLWVQFVDHEVVIGEPCPCGGQLLQVNQNFAECSSCHATVALLRPRREKTEPGDVVTEDEPLLVGLFGAPALRAQKNGRRPRPEAVPSPPDPRRDLVRLGAYSQVVLHRFAGDERRERLYGHGLGPGNRRWLLVVDRPLVDGEPVPDRAYPAGFVHTVWSMPANFLGSLVDLAALDQGDAGLTVEDPLAGYEAPTDSGMPLGVPEPPSRLEELEELALFPLAGSEAKKAPRSVGLARTREGGEAVLVVVRGSDDGDAADVRCVPLEPFAGIVDVAALRGADPGTPLDELTVKPQAGPKPPDIRNDLTKLGAFTNVELFAGPREPGRERMRGWATLGGQRCLLVVDFPLRDGERIADGAWPGGWRHLVWSAPAGPLQGLLRKDAFADAEPEIRIDDPLAGFQPSEPAEGANGAVPSSLEDLLDVHLAGRGKGEEKKRETYLGHARTRDGETVLFTLRRTRQGGQESLRCVPLAPLEGVIDTEALFSLDFDAEQTALPQP
jgi:hypothetical protein